MTNHVDCFYAAVSVLAGDGHIKQRLTDAYADHIAEIDSDDLPAPLREQFLELTRRMYAVAPLNGEGSIRASVRKMSGQDAAECAQILVALHSELLRLAGRGKRRADNDPDLAKPFLVKTASG